MAAAMSDPVGWPSETRRALYWPSSPDVGDEVSLALEHAAGPQVAVAFPGCLKSHRVELDSLTIALGRAVLDR